MTGGGSPFARGPAAIPRPTDLPWRRGRLLLVVGVILAIQYWSAVGTRFSPAEFVSGLPAMANLFQRMSPPRWDILPDLVKPLLETLRMAIAGTTLGALFAIPLALLSARNITSNPALLWPARTVLNLVRTTPDLLLAAIFVAAFGIGMVPGVGALAAFSLGIVAKLTFESTEAIDPGPLEALEATGASRLQSIAFAVVPQVLPQFVAYVLYMFEINIRASAVIGLVGAGGIGHILNVYMQTFRYQQVAVIILVTFAFVLVLDTLSTWIRERLI